MRNPNTTHIHIYTRKTEASIKWVWTMNVDLRLKCEIHTNINAYPISFGMLNVF